MRVLDGTCELHLRPEGEAGDSSSAGPGAGSTACTSVPARSTAWWPSRTYGIVEVSTPELDDVVRLADRYGRAGTSAP